MARSPRSYQFVIDIYVITKQVERMNSGCFSSISELSSVIGLDNQRFISKVCNSPFDKIYG